MRDPKMERVVVEFINGVEPGDGHGQVVERSPALSECAEALKPIDGERMQAPSVAEPRGDDKRGDFTEEMTESG
jgi:hypothetical protein